MVISSLLVFGKNGPWNNVCWSSNEKTSLPRQKKNIDFTQRTYWNCFKGVNPWFCSTIGKNSSQRDFGQMSLEIMFGDHPSRKQAFLDHTNIDFTQWPYWDFFKEVSLWFWSKIRNFIFACFWTKIALEIILCVINHLVKKQVFLDYQNMDFI